MSILKIFCGCFFLSDYFINYFKVQLWSVTIYLPGAIICSNVLKHSSIPKVHLFKGHVLLDFSLTVKAATLIFIPKCGSAISSAKEGKSGFIYNSVKS